MATHSSILGWRIPLREQSGGLQSMGHKELDIAERLTLSLCWNVNRKPSNDTGLNMKLYVLCCVKSQGRA